MSGADISRPAPRVLVTRALGSASALADALRVLGAEPLVVPAIEIAEPSSFAVLDEALARLGEFDWLVFTSATAVEVFGHRMGDRSMPVPRIAAIGSATARALSSLGLKADIVPSAAIAESLTEALLPHVREEDGSAARFLLVRAEAARELLPEALRDAGGNVTVAPAYRTVVPAGAVQMMREIFGLIPEEEGQLRAQRPLRAQRNATVLWENWPDAVTFTSSSTVVNFFSLLEAAGVDLRKRRPVLASIGPITSGTLREMGYPPDVEASEASVQALAKAVFMRLRGI